ncbi:tetratricopeptide repeat protein [Streptomyces sp. NPDC058246]|uniref:tetratricopeptide repeat protein n=1 Tax=Streptomyces sp. NPDC058246 TaxID=3346400 RepID=UPI0036E757BE
MLTGMGGTGKTQAAVNAARQAWQDRQLDLLVWVNAASRQAILEAYAQAGSDVLGVDPALPELAARRFLAWLEHGPVTPEQRWMVILDDLNAPEDLRDLWPPETPYGRTVITTRRRDAALLGRAEVIDVDLFSPGEAAAYLQAGLAAHHRPASETECAALAGALGHLPLALSQAVAYLVDADEDIPAYLARLADHTRRLADLLPEHDSLPDGQHATAASAWALSVERANQLRPRGLAGPVLTLISVLDSHAVPETALTCQMARAFAAPAAAPSAVSGTPRPAAAVPAEDEVRAALRVLHRLHLIEHTSNDPYASVAIHPLVHRALRDDLTDPESTAQTAANCLLEVWPPLEQDTGLARALRANTEALIRHSGAALWRPRLHSVIFRLGRSLGEAGHHAAAAAHFHRASEAADQYLGAAHGDTLAARGHHVRWLGASGEPAQAARLAADLIADITATRGSDHDDTLAVRAQHAHWTGVAGGPLAAMELTSALLQDRERLQGADHPDVFTTRGNLARWYGLSGAQAAAVRGFRQLVADRTRVQGAEHRDTLTSRGNLAHWRGVAGTPIEAVQDFSALLNDRTRILGAEHPDTLTTRRQLAHWQGLAGHLQQAYEGYASFVTDLGRLLGWQHPDVLRARAACAHWRGTAGDPEAAMNELESLYEDLGHFYGHHHPDTLSAAAQLAHWQGTAGYTQTAAELTGMLVGAREQLLGPDHPTTLDMRARLVLWLAASRQESRAARELTELIHDEARVHGPQHARTGRARDALLHLRLYPGNRDDGIPTTGALLEALLHLLGPDHPSTLTARDSLARWQQDTDGSQPYFGQ